MKYGLIGEHLSHSYSCEIHAKLAEYPYELCELTPEALGPFMESRDFRAINVTVPYKQKVMPYLDEISDLASRVGAVNTVVNRGGRLFGDNTDFAGMEALIKHAKMSLKDKKVLILGTGGTSATAVAVAKHLNAREILVVSRKVDDDVLAKAKAPAVTYEEALHLHTDAQMIINTTPVGMYHSPFQGAPIDISPFSHLEGVIDAIFHPLRTPLVISAMSSGIPACGGLYMLVAQAVYASALFLDRKPEEDLIDSVYASLCREKQNVVLIGMPSSGKTTVGKNLAARLGQPFADTDKLISDRIGMPISKYIPAVGEAAFRTLESQVIADISDESGLVIATGGGAILRPENIRELHKNGVLIFLDRSLDNLITTDDRPLSSNRRSLETLYKARYDKYMAAADLRVDGDRPVSAVADSILKALQEVTFI